MAKSETIRMAFEVIKKNRCNFCIRTNVAIGHGINGTDFPCYYGIYQYNSCDEGFTAKMRNVQLFEDFMVIHYFNGNKDDYFSSGEHTIFLPYENVVCIDITSGVKRGRYVWPENCNVEIEGL